MSLNKHTPFYSGPQCKIWFKCLYPFKSKPNMSKENWNETCLRTFFKYTVGLQVTYEHTHSRVSTFPWLEYWKITKLYSALLEMANCCNLERKSTRFVTSLGRWHSAPCLGRSDTYVYTGCPRRNVPDFGRAFLMLKYTDITQNTYVQSWTVTEIMAREVWNFESCYTIVDYQIHIKTGRNMWFL